MYVPIYFRVQELVPPDLYSKYKGESLFFMDDRITITLDRIRKHFGSPVTVNNWDSGGKLEQRGYRNDFSTGTPFSAHRFGRAVDFDVKGLSAEMFREWGRITIHPDTINCLEYITRIENGTTWNHIDCMGPPKSQGQPIAFFNK